MRRGRAFGWACAAAAVAGVLACSGAPAVEPVCTPGESRACACSSGAMGAQVCDDTGERLGPCECDVDAGAPRDGGRARDAGGDASIVDVDAGRDAGRAGPMDAGRDSGPPAACDLVTQEGCGITQACRRSRGPGPTFTSPPSGPPHCEPAGTITREWDTTVDCRVDGQDQCARGLFCLSTHCVRFCDPEGAPCPPMFNGAEQRCLTSDMIGIDPYCSPFAP